MGGRKAQEQLLYIHGNIGRLAVDMDIFWSICAMPIGLMICFSPIVVVWITGSAKRKAALAEVYRRRERP